MEKNTSTKSEMKESEKKSKRSQSANNLNKENAKKQAKKPEKSEKTSQKTKNIKETKNLKNSNTDSKQNSLLKSKKNKTLTTKHEELTEKLQKKSNLAAKSKNQNSQKKKNSEPDGQKTEQNKNIKNQKIKKQDNQNDQKTKNQNNQKAKKQSNQKSSKEISSKQSLKQISIPGFHDLSLCTYILDEVKNPKAVVVVIHGMQEHCLRYLSFAEFLNKNGYVVILNDLRGHGKTMQTPDDYGHGEKDIFSESVQDELQIVDYAAQKYNLPIYVFGHSYGSMLTQKLVQISPQIEKAVICGTTNGSCMLFALASGLVSMLAPFNRKDKRGGFAEKMCIKSYGKKFERGNWLTRDEAVFEKYLADELCGGSFPFSFYRDMVKNMRKINNGIQKIGNKKLFLIAGDCDPVGENGKQVKKLHKIYLKNNIDAKLKIYPGARHELINETNKDEIFADILNFYNN